MYGSHHISIGQIWLKLSQYCVGAASELSFGIHPKVKLVLTFPVYQLFFDASAQGGGLPFGGWDPFSSTVSIFVCWSWASPDAAGLLGIPCHLLWMRILSVGLILSFIWLIRLLSEEYWEFQKLGCHHESTFSISFNFLLIQICSSVKINFGLLSVILIFFVIWSLKNAVKW